MSEEQKALSIAEMKVLSSQYKSAKHSKDANHIADKVMLMLDAIIDRLEGK